MRTVVYCFVVLAVASLSECSLDSAELLVNMRVGLLSNILQEKGALQQAKLQIEAICPGYQDRFEKAFMKFAQCSNLIDDDSETMCSAIGNHFEKCAKPVVDILEDCIPQRSKGVPSLISKGLLATSDYMCKTDGEHIFELSNLCIRSSSYRTERCMRKIVTKMQLINQTQQFPSKEELCEFVFSFKACFQSHLLASCGNPKTREAFLNVYNTMITPCQPNDSLNEVQDSDKKRVWMRAN